MPLVPLAAALLAFSVASQAAPPGAPGATTVSQPQGWLAGSQAFVAQYMDAKTHVAQAFLTGQPVEQVLTTQLFGKLSGLIPADDSADSIPGIELRTQDARDQVAHLIRIKEQAMAVQAGRHADDPPAIFKQTITVAAEGVLGRKPTDNELAAVYKLYGEKNADPKASPRQKSQGELVMDAEAARRLLQDPHLDPKIASQVTAKTGQYAQALGGLLFTDGAGNAVIVGRRSPTAPLSQAELDHIARLPRVQVPKSIAGLEREIPVPVTHISDDAPQMGQAGFQYGWATSAYKHWDDIAKAQDELVSNGQRGPLMATLAYTGATVMKGFWHISGFGAVEQSANQLEWDKNRDAPRERQRMDKAKFVGNTALAAVNFIPVLGVAGKGAALYRSAQGGAEIAELAGGVGRTTAADAASEIRTVIANAGKSGTVSTNNAVDVLHGLQRLGSEYGVEIREARDLRSLGSSAGGPGELVVNTRVGAAHEVTHAVQQSQVRFTLLKQMGKRYDQLSEAERALFAERVKAMESATKPFEEGASRATGFMGGPFATAGRYTRGLEANVSAFQDGLATGTVPRFGWSLSKPTSALYGELPDLLGKSQGEILKNMAYAGNAFLRPSWPIINQAAGSGIDYLTGLGQNNDRPTAVVRATRNP